MQKTRYLVGMEEKGIYLYSKVYRRAIVIDRSVLSQKEERCRQAVWILVLKSSIKMRTFIFFSRQKPVLPGAFEMCISQKTRHSRKIP